MNTVIDIYAAYINAACNKKEAVKYSSAKKLI